MENIFTTMHRWAMNPLTQKILPLLRSLSIQFLVAGGVVMVVAAWAVGTWVANRIEHGVVQNSGTAAALYIESLIPSQSWGPGGGAAVSEEARLTLRQVFEEGILSERVVTYNIWSETGEVLDSYRPEQRGLVYEPSEALLAAWSGEVTSQFQTLRAETDHPETTLGVPLLEVYVPIRDTYTGEVLFVVEFYQRAEGLAEELAAARRGSWMLVSQIFGLSGALLFIIVHAGSRLIERQRKQLQLQLIESRSLSENNDALRKRIAQAAQRSTTQSEKIMQRIGQDLHDGVAQHLSVASLRLEAAGLNSTVDSDIVSLALANAMTELRAISRGLALPDLAALTLNDCVAEAVSNHNKSFGSDVQLHDDATPIVGASYSTKLCAYRFVQEALSNASRHAKATEISVQMTVDSEWINITASDNGLGFDVDARSALREDGGQGLIGLSDRAATLGGRIEIRSGSGKGTVIQLHLPILEDLE